MHNKIKVIMILLASISTIYSAMYTFKYFDPIITEKRAEQTKLKNELSISPEDYKSMVKDLETERDSLYEQINRQTDSITSMEDNMAFLLKEDILVKVSDAVEDTGAYFDNFYVTFEGSIKNDYSVQVEGNIYQINKFIENLFIGTPGISIGEFSMREKDDSSFLVRYFDESNALMWYDGSIYNAPENSTNNNTSVDIENIKDEVMTKLPRADKITYVLTLTFRV